MPVVSAWWGVEDALHAGEGGYCGDAVFHLRWEGEELGVLTENNGFFFFSSNDSSEEALHLGGVSDCAVIFDAFGVEFANAFLDAGEFEFFVSGGVSAFWGVPRVYVRLGGIFAFYDAFDE